MAESSECDACLDGSSEDCRGAVVMGMVMLICAVLASLALGVLAAYGICQVMFRVFRSHAETAARTRVAGQRLRAIGS